MSECECTVCVESYSHRNAKVTCIHCGFEACRQCCKKFMMNSINDAKCMQCGKEWNREFLVQSFPYVFVDKEYKHYRENLLFEREKAKLAETQVVIERRERIKGYGEKIKRLKEEIAEKKEEIRSLETRRWDERYGSDKVKVENVRFFGHCPKGDCKGFINASWRCGICEQKVCRSCKEPIGNDDDALKTHACNPETLASLRMVKQDSKPCPKCKVPIIKVSGCNQMWCTVCNIAFDWRTGEQYVRNIHNPHYFEWLRRTGGVNVEEGQCREDLPYSLWGCFDNVSEEQKIHINEIIRLGRHIQYYEMPGLNHAIRNDDNLENRIRYMTNETSEKDFKIRLQRDDKKRERDREKYLIMDMFVNTLKNYTYEYILHRLPTSMQTRRGYNRRQQIFESINPERCERFIELIEELILYTNESMLRLKKIYKNKFPVIEKEQTRRRNIWHYTVTNK